MIISENSLKMDPTKVNRIKDWKAPKTVKQIWSFLGFCNFYRRFIGRFTDISKPLTELIKKKTMCDWSEKCESAFRELKDKFLRQPIFIMPDSKQSFTLETDASKWASGGVLRQKGSDGEWHSCGYISQTFSAAERNYEIYDRELLAIVRALEIWKHYLLGTPFTTVVLCDHKNLSYFRSAQKLNRRQARWGIFLSEFDLKLIHTPEAKMIQSDALSRRPDHITDDDENDDKILLPDDIFIKMINLEMNEKLR
jgi:hypothetical protein